MDRSRVSKTETHLPSIKEPAKCRASLRPIGIGRASALPNAKGPTMSQNLKTSAALPIRREHPSYPSSPSYSGAGLSLNSRQTSIPLQKVPNQLPISNLPIETPPRRPRDNPATPRDKVYISPRQPRQRRGSVAAPKTDGRASNELFETESPEDFSDDRPQERLSK